MSQLEVWHLLNVIFKLYRVIANCYDLCNLYVEKKVLLMEKWLDKDRKIASYYRMPQHYAYGADVSIELSDRTFEELHEFIIERNDFPLAMDFVQPNIHLDYLIKTMRKVEEQQEMKFSSLGFIISLRDFRVEIYKWAAVQSSRINSSIEKEMARRETMTYSLLCDERNSEMILREEPARSADSAEKVFNLANFFIQEYKVQNIVRIYEYLTLLNQQKDALHITQMASVIAIAWERRLLCETYSNTLQEVFDHFGIKEKVENYKPARLRRSSYKGNPPLTRVQALKFFQSIENIPCDL